jgi:hypothetical protein
MGGVRDGHDDGHASCDRMYMKLPHWNRARQERRQHPQNLRCVCVCVYVC